MSNTLTEVSKAVIRGSRITAFDGKHKEAV